ncbi:MAG: AAA family ATPase [Candidatus Nitrosopolaris sp.]
MSKCIAFHSYKGGTGKTTLAANLAASLAKKGYKVFLLDFDVYAPSLQSYFEFEPKKWINDFLFEKAELKEVLLDLTHLIEGGGGSGKSTCGQLWVGFCNAKKEEIFKLEGRTSRLNVFRRFIHLRELLSYQYKADYIIIDTSPGIRYWSINALVVAEVLLLTLKMTDLDIVGTRALATEIYASLTKFGAMSFLLLNRVSGYCLPYTMQNTTEGQIGTSLRGPTLEASSLLPMNGQLIETDMQNFITKETGMKILSVIPCYCDIQFSRKEFLTVLNQPEHLFAKQFEQLVHAIETI